MRRQTWQLTLLAGLMLAGLSGCPSNPTENTGKLDVALLGTSPSGTIYRLRQANLVVQGPSSTLFFNTEEDPNRTTLSANVVAGAYSVFLQEGWHLERIAADGSGVRVQATFLSPNPQNFTVTANNRTVVNLHFRAGPDDVTMDQGSFDIVLQVDDPGPIPIVNCNTNAECPAGQTCCVAGFLGTCQALAAGQACPLPDLTVSLETAQQSMSISTRNFPETSCALVEHCVDAAGDRRLLSFSTQTPNIGQADMVLGDPTSQPGFEFSSCHGHFHFEGYAEYQLLDAAGNIAATGHKQAFCLLDSSPVGIPGSPTTPRYHCGFQGIQRGWSDIYGAGLDCQWVDITNVADGDYRLRITINPTHILPESNYDNNTIEIPVHIAPNTPPIPGDPLSACPPGQAGSRECGWAIATGFEAATCTPGANVTLGCGCSSVGTCAGDPMLRVCEGANTACSATTALFNIDDACGLCPQGTFVCPPSGVYTVLREPFRDGQPFTCEPAVAP